MSSCKSCGTDKMPFIKSKKKVDNSIVKVEWICTNCGKRYISVRSVESDDTIR